MTLVPRVQPYTAPHIAGHTTLSGVLDASARVIAVVGLAKNAGKTTVVNTLLANSDCCLGLTSLGLDGEAVDHLTGLPKPRIQPPAGTLVATTEGSLARSHAGLAVLERLPFHTALGAVIIGRTDGRSALEVSGPTTLGELRATVDRLRAHGAQRVFVDGAVNRFGSASPSVSDAVILATGGTVADNLDDMLAATVDAVDLLTLPQVARSEREALLGLAQGARGLVSIDHRGGVTELSSAVNLVGGAAAAREMQRLKTRTLLVRGAVTEAFLADLVRLLPARAQPRLVVRDATTVIAPARTISRCRRAGIAFEVLTPLRLLAVTVNPFHLPHAYPATQLFAAVVAHLGDRIALYDIQGGLSSNPDDARVAPSAHGRDQSE